jgi:hypothetical protein
MRVLHASGGFLQDALPVRNIDPSIKLESDLLKVGHFLKPEFFMNSDTCLVWQCDASDDCMNAKALQAGDEATVEQ